MKKTIIKEEFNKIFQIVGEELNLSNNFTYMDYKKLDSDTKKMFDDVLDYKLKEKRGIFRTDFQIALDKLNKSINKKYNKNNVITNLKDIDSILKNDYSFIDGLNNKDEMNLYDEFNKPVFEEKIPIRKKIANYWNNMPEGLRNASLISLAGFVGTRILFRWSAWTISTGALTAAGVTGVGTLVIPSILALHCGYKGLKKYIKKKKSEKSSKSKNDKCEDYSFDTMLNNSKNEDKLEMVVPDSFGLDKKEESNEVLETVPEVPVFRKPKKDDNGEKAEIIVPDSFELDENKENDKLSKQIEETKKSLQQVKDNIAKLKQKESVITEELNSLNQDIAEQENIISQELNEKDNEFDNLISNEEILPKGSFNDNDIVETEFIDNNPKDDLENQINKDYKPKHLKREDKPSKDEKKQKIEEDIKSCERVIEILQYKTILPETDEQKQYVKDKIKIYKNKLRRLKEQQKKQDLSNFDYQFAIRRKKLESKLDNIEKNDANKKIISDIEIAISQIDSYMKYSDAYKNGFISEDELNNKGNNTYMIVDYVMNERQKRTRK